MIGEWRDMVLRADVARAKTLKRSQADLIEGSSPADHLV